MIAWFVHVARERRGAALRRATEILNDDSAAVETLRAYAHLHGRRFSVWP